MYDKRDFTDVMKYKFMRWGDYPVLSGWALNVVTSILIRSRKRFDHRREGDMKTEAAIVVVRPQ